jgi:hypothetical protein
VSPISRRWFLIGGASAVALAACGGDDDDDDTAASSSTSTTAEADAGLAIVRVFAPQQPAGIPLRLPIALADADGGLLDIERVPETIRFQYGPEGGPLSESAVVQRHSQGIPNPYFPLLVTLEPGTHRIEVEADGQQAATTIEAVPPNQTAVVPVVGAPLIPLQTPTTADPRGVEPICTRDPVCPFHDQTLEEAMASGKAVAFLISTPQFCQTAICGPVLDLLIDRQEQFADVVAFVHAEVYTDDTASATTEAVQAYGLTWEPSLFLAMPDGTIASRLDYTYDGVEIDEALSKLVQ